MPRGVSEQSDEAPSGLRGHFKRSYIPYGCGQKSANITSPIRYPWPPPLGTWRIFGMVGSEIFCTARKKSTHISMDSDDEDDQYGSWNRVVGTLEYEGGLKVVLRTINFNLFRVSFYAHLLGIRAKCLYDNLTGRWTQIFPFSMAQINTRLLLGRTISPRPREVCPTTFNGN